jgi:phage gp16-like protein
MSDRRNDLAKIHLAKKQLGLDDDAYRDMLWVAARVRSASDLDEYGRRSVIEHLRKCGATFARPKKAGKRPHNYNQLPEYITKVEALLADMGLSWAYADTIARNITGGKGSHVKDPGVERLAWVKGDRHWRAIIAALSVEQEKRGLLDSVDELLQKLGKDHDYLKQLFPSLPQKWQRDRRWLRAIVERLAHQVEVI